jgi:hypothetical protein
VSERDSTTSARSDKPDKSTTASHRRAKRSKPAKPSKPYPEFPLTAHPAGYWCKKIRGKIHYFGPWNDSDAALVKYEEQAEALHAGRTPRPETEALTIKQLVNAFLTAKQASVDSRELLPRTWNDYKQAFDLLITRFGKAWLVEDLAPPDFAALRQHMAKNRAPTSVRSVIQRVRCVFRFAADNRLIKELEQLRTDWPSGPRSGRELPAMPRRLGDVPYSMATRPWPDHLPMIDSTACVAAALISPSGSNRRSSRLSSASFASGPKVPRVLITTM